MQNDKKNLYRQQAMTANLKKLPKQFLNLHLNGK